MILTVPIETWMKALIEPSKINEYKKWMRKVKEKESGRKH